MQQFGPRRYGMFSTEFVLLLQDLKHAIKRQGSFSMAGYRICGLLVTAPNGMHIRKIGRVLGLTTSVISREVTGLVRRGLLSEKPDPADRRAVLVSATPAGHKALARTDRAVETCVEDAWSCLSYEQRKLTVWGSLLAASEHRSARSKEGEINLYAAYVEALCLSAGAYRKAVRTCGLTLDEYRALDAAERIGPGARAKEIGIEALLTSSQVAVALSALQQGGLVRQRGSEKDRRLRLYSATGAGSALLEELDPKLEHAAKFGVVPISRYDIEDYGKIAETLVASLRERFTYV